MAEIGVMKKLTIGGSTYTIPEYNLPIASASILGGVKIGTGLSINSTTGVLSATGLDYDEADPIFVASPAYSITSDDITNWNSKTSNTGTITKVQTSAGTHTTVNISSGNVSFNVPTKTSHLTNDSGFLTSSDLASVLIYKGTKASVADVIAISNPKKGDVWHVTADGSEYAWDGTTWQELGTAVDLSAYALKSELPTDTNTWRLIQVDGVDKLGSGIDTGKLNLKAGNAITLSESSGTVTFNHSDTSSQASSSNSGRTYIQSITLDTYGHITGISTATETVTNTDTKLQVAAVTSGTTYYPIVGTGTTAATRQYDTTGFVYKGTNGTTSAVGSAQLTLGNSTASGTANNKQGQLIMYGSNAKKATITLAAPSADISLALPTSGGTLALTSQIPTVPTIPTSTNSATTGVTATTTATKTTLGTAGSVTGVSGSTTASKASGSNGSASNWVFEDVACDDITAWSAGSGSASFAATVTSHVLSFSHSHTHTAPTLTYSGKTASHVKSGGNGTAPSWSFTDVTVPKAAASATSIPNVSVESATVSITDPGHTHTI